MCYTNSMSNELILQYQSDPTNKEIEDKLLEIHAPYIKANINKWKGSIPQPIIEAYGRKYALDAFKTYDPTKAAINTHLYNHISQLSRLIYQHQNISSIPESQIQYIGRINQAKEYLQDQLDREPTLDEISYHVKMPVKHIKRIIENQRADFVNDSDKEHQQFGVRETDISTSNKIFSYRNQLNDLQKQQFDSITGFGGTQPLSPKDIGKQFKLKPYEVTRLKNYFAKGLK